MSFIGAAVAAYVGTTVFTADQARKTSNRQAAALESAREDDARKTAEAETSAQVAANAKTAETTRRRRSNALALGDPSGSDATLGGGSVLSMGGPAPAARNAAVGAASGGSALGAGAPSSVAGRVRTPTKPTRANSI